MTTLTQASIVALLAKSDKAVARALVVLHERQTADEQRSEETRHHNNQGFTPAHARPGSGMASFYLRNGYLSPKQIAFWRKPNKRGVMRIAMYWRQLIEEAQAKASTQPTGMLSVSEVNNFAMAAERRMQQMEAEGDRAQTRRDERNKFVHRTSMEVFTPFSASGGDR